MARKLREIMEEAAEGQGDSLAAAQMRDTAEEEGDISDLAPKKGQEVVLYTVTWIHRGILIGVDHEYYYLKTMSDIVYDTGQHEKFFSQGPNKGPDKKELKAADADAVPCRSCVRKGAVTCVVILP